VLRKTLPWALEIPSPLSAWWERFEVFKSGCPYCRGRDMKFLSSSLGRITGYSRLPFLTVADEKLNYKCDSCGNSSIFIFVSPSSPPISEGGVRRAVRDFFDLFARDATKERNTPDYTTFHRWAHSLLEKSKEEESLRNIPVYEWVIDEVKELAKEMETEMEKLKENRNTKEPAYIYVTVKLLIYFHEYITPVLEVKG